MKLKRFLPATTMLGCAIIAAPVIASCSCGANISTSDVNFVFEEQHKAETITTNEQKDALIQDYISTPNHFAQDYFYGNVNKAKEIKNDLEHSKSAGAIQTYDFDFSSTLNGLQIKKDTANISSKENVNGFSINGRMTTSIKSREYKPTRNNNRFVREREYLESITFQNVFVYFDTDEVSFWECREKNWVSCYSIYEVYTNEEINISTGLISRTTNVIQDKEINKSWEGGNHTQIISFAPFMQSRYLENVQIQI